MAEVKQLPKRHEIQEEMTWDLKLIFESDEAFEQELKEVSGLAGEVKALQGTLGTSGEALLKGIEKVLEVNRKLEKVYVYSHLKNDQDTANSTYQTMHDKSLAVLTQIREASSWFNPEVLAIPEATLAAYMEETEGLHAYKHLIDDLT